MKITEIKAIPIDIEFVAPFTTSWGPETVRKHVLVQIKTDEGINGIGEAAPMSRGFHEEFPESILNLINRYWAPAIIGEDPFNIEKIFEKLGRIKTKNTYAKAAIDFALFDIQGKALKAPVYNLLGGLYRSRIPIAWVIGINKSEIMVEEAIRKVDEGFRVLKIKIGTNPRNDVELVKMMRDAIGDVTLRADANAGYASAKVAIKAIKKMERYEMQLIEQPIAAWDLDGMGKITKAVETPIMADESMFDIHSALEIARKGAADIINIKLMKPGGLYFSKKVAAICEAANIPVLVGSMLESSIATAAGIHFAAATKIALYEAETIGPLYIKNDVVKESVKFDGGYAYLPTKVGLGVELNEQIIKK